MTRTLRALAALLLLPALGLASGCTDTVAAPGVGASAQTTDALTLLPANADVVGMMDFQAARGSEALDAMTGGAGLGFMSGEGSQDFDTFVRQTGFDPATDLDRVYVAASEGGAGRAAFVAYGRFDRDRIERYVAGQPDLDLEATDVEGLPVYLARSDDGERGGFALVNDQMILGGDEATLGQMIRRLGTAGQAPSADLQALLDRVQYPDGAWFVARGLDRMGGAVPADAPPAALARPGRRRRRAVDGVRRRRRPRPRLRRDARRHRRRRRGGRPPRRHRGGQDGRQWTSRPPSTSWTGPRSRPATAASRSRRS